MPDKFTALTPELHRYLVAHSGPPDPLLERLVAETEELAGERAVMQVAPGAGGALITCDVSEEWTALARRYWEEAGVAERIDLRLAPALETLADLRGTAPFDFAFIDADKATYPDYWEAVVELLRPGGIAVVDNVLYGGAVAAALDGDDAMRPWAGAGQRSESLEAIIRTNERIAADERVDSVMLGVADGITIALRR